MKSKEEQAGLDLVGEFQQISMAMVYREDVKGIRRVDEIGVWGDQQEGQRTIAIFFFIYILKQANKQTKALVKGPVLSGFVQNWKHSIK